MQIKNLSPNPQNPRRVSDAKLETLRRTLATFGDLSGIVFNRRTNQIVGGHQRSKIFDSEARIIITQKFKTPTASGTMLEGFIIHEGENYSYREVDWDEIKEKAANIAANKGVGEWDTVQLGEWFKDLDEYNFDMDLTLFDDFEVKNILETPKSKKRKVEFEVDENQQIKTHKCPECGCNF